MLHEDLLSLVESVAYMTAQGDDDTLRVCMKRGRSINPIPAMKPWADMIAGLTVELSRTSRPGDIDNDAERKGAGANDKGNDTDSHGEDEDATEMRHASDVPAPADIVANSADRLMRYMACVWARSTNSRRAG